MNLGDFIDTYKEAISQRVVESYPPLYRPSENGGTLPRLLRTPLGAQADAIRGRGPLPRSPPGHNRPRGDGHRKDLHRRRCRIYGGLQAHPGAWAAPPGAQVEAGGGDDDARRLRFSIGSGPLFAVMSREKAKLSYRWKAAVIERWAVSRGRLLRDEETGEPFRVPCCPGCTAQVVDKDGVPLTDEDLNRRKRNCAGCGSPLWQADRSGPARYPLADYVKHRMRGFFDLLIGDEIHECAPRNAA